MPNTEQLLYQTDKTSHWRCSIKKAVIKIFTTFTRKSLLEFLFHKVAELQLMKRDSNTAVFQLQNFCKTPIFKNICIQLLPNWLYEVIVRNFVSGQSLSSQGFKYSLARMPSSYLTPTLCFEIRFCMFIINSYYTKSKRLQSLYSFLYQQEAHHLYT